MAKKEVIKKVKIEVTDGGALKKTKQQIDALNNAQRKGSKSSMEYNRNMKGLSKQSSNASKNFSKQAQGMQGVLVPAYAEIAARVFALSAAFNALSNAADFRILMQGQAEYAKRTGKNMADIAKSVQKASKNMLGFKEASSAVALATTSGIGNQQIVKMTKAAVDSSTALGRSVSDTMDRLTRGIVKAEPEILDEIGVIIRLDQVYKDYAESVRKSTTELTEGEKATARYNAIMGQLETKFGGIGDSVDPNYFKATGAAVLDTIDKMSSGLVKMLNPILKFLSESKQLIVVILAVVLKTLAGKIFPALGGMGKSLSEMPHKMDKGIQKLDNRINRLNSSITKSKTKIQGAKKVLQQMVPENQRGKAWSATSSDRQIRRSVLAQAKYADANIGTTGDKKGLVTSGPWAGKTKAEVAAIRTQVKAMGKEMSIAQGKVRKFFIQGAKAGATMRKSLLGIRKGWAESTKQAMRYFNSTKKFIAHRGLIEGTALAFKRLGRAWAEVNMQAGLFNAVTKTAKASLSSLAVVAGITGAVLSKLFSWVIVLSVVASMSKMILGIWIDFDSKMAKASKSAKELKGHLAGSLENLQERDQIINFEGIAVTFDDAMANAQFAANFSEQFYDQVSGALKKINADIESMSWWDKLWDKVKDAVGLGFKDNLYKDVSLMGKIFDEGYGEHMPDVMAQLRKDMPEIFQSSADIIVRTLDDGLRDSIKNGGYFEAIQALEDAGLDGVSARLTVDKAKLQGNLKGIMDQLAVADAKGGNIDGQGNAIGNAATANPEQLKKYYKRLIIDDLHDPMVTSVVKSDKAIPKTFQQVMDHLNSMDDSVKGTQAFVDTMQHMSNIMEEVHKKEKKRLEDMRALTTAFDDLSKARINFQESLIVKTGVHDMAVEQDKIVKMWKDDNISTVEKVLSAQRAGLLDNVSGYKGKGGLVELQKEMVDKKKATDRGKLTESEWMEVVDPGGQLAKKIKGIQERMFLAISGEDGIKSLFKHDFIGYDKDLMSSATKRLKLEEKISLLKFGKSSPGNIQATARIQKEIAILNLKEAKVSLEVLRADDNSTYQQRSQALVNYNIKLREAQALENVNLKMAESRAKIDAKNLTIEERYAAMYQDRVDNERAWGIQYTDKNWNQWFNEKNTALVQYANNFALTIDKNIADSEKLRIVLENLEESLGANAENRTYKAMKFSWSKFLPKELLDPKNMKYLTDLAVTSEGKQTLSKFKTVKLEVLKNKLEMDNLTMSKGQLAFRKALATIELNVANKQHQFAQKRLETELRISNLRKEIAILEREEAVRWAVDAMREIADGFGSALKSSLTDVFMNKGFSMDKFRTGIAQSFASAGAGIIANTTKKAVFGNQGFLANMMRGTKLEGMVDDLFPKTQLEIARDDLAVSQQQLSELGSIRQVLEMQSGVPSFGTPQKGFEYFMGNHNNRNDGYNMKSGVGSALTNVLMGVITGRFAKGGVVPGGFRAFANGGITSKPTLGLMGEGKYNEAVVPLPDGKSIPVKGAAGNVTVNVSVDANGQSGVTNVSGEGAKELGYLVSQAVQAELVDQQRPGGLLSSY